MDIRDLNGKSIAILGAHGREGMAMQEALKRYAPDAKVDLRDRKDSPDYLENLNEFDCVIKAPGIPPHLITNHEFYTDLPRFDRPTDHRDRGNRIKR